MDENKEQKDYQKGFNEGYLIAKHLPELAEQLSKVDLDSFRNSGFQEGRKQFLVERTKDRYPSWLSGERFKRNDVEPEKNKDRDKDLDLDLDRETDFEPER